MTAAPTRQIYKDRLGRVITDPEAIHHRFITQQFRRLDRLGLRAGKLALETVTVAELAKAAKIEPGKLVEIIRDERIWLMSIAEREGEPLEQWWVFEDGE